MGKRVDALLEELRARHGADPEFMEQLRPSVERILDPLTPAESRAYLLEVLAETCERQVGMTRDLAEIRRALEGCFATIHGMLRRLAERQSEDPGAAGG